MYTRRSISIENFQGYGNVAVGGYSYLLDAMRLLRTHRDFLNLDRSRCAGTLDGVQKPNRYAGAIRRTEMADG